MGRVYYSGYDVPMYLESSTFSHDSPFKASNINDDQDHGRVLLPLRQAWLFTQINKDDIIKLQTKIQTTISAAATRLGGTQTNSGNNSNTEKSEYY
jgi:hypothetical protein